MKLLLLIPKKQMVVEEGKNFSLYTECPETTYIFTYVPNFLVVHAIQFIGCGQ